MTQGIEPLSPELWFERLEIIAKGELRETERGLRHALHLLQLTPLEFRLPEYDLIDEETFESLLDVGDLDTAARCLVACPSLGVTSLCSGGMVQVALACRANTHAVIGTGSCLAAALLQAWARSLLKLRSESGLREFKQAVAR